MLGVNALSTRPQSRLCMFINHHHDTTYETNISKEYDERGYEIRIRRDRVHGSTGSSWEHPT